MVLPSSHRCPPQERHAAAPLAVQKRRTGPSQGYPTGVTPRATCPSREVRSQYPIPFPRESISGLSPPRFPAASG
jgi:hypothetical protein